MSVLLRKLPAIVLFAAAVVFGTGALPAEAATTIPTLGSCPEGTSVDLGGGDVIKCVHGKWVQVRPSAPAPKAMEMSRSAA